MKKFFILAVLASLFVSCSLDDDIEGASFEIMPIESVEIPDTFIFGQTHEVSVTYTRPSNCHSFYDFIYEINGNERTIAVTDIVAVSSLCEDTEIEATVSFNFSVSSTETYLFKFFQGVDDNGEDQFYLVEVPVEI